MTIKMTTTKESVQSLKMYQAYEKHYVTSKIDSMTRHLNTINELLENNVKHQVIMDDMEGFYNSYFTALKYMLKQFKNVDIKGLDGSTHEFFYFVDDYVYSLYQQAIDYTELMFKVNDFIMKECYFDIVKRCIKDLKLQYQAYFKNIEML